MCVCVCSANQRAANQPPEEHPNRARGQTQRRRVPSRPAETATPADGCTCIEGLGFKV